MRMIDADRMLSELKPITYDMEQNAVTIADMSNIMRNWVMRQPTISSTQWISVEDNLPPLDTNIIVCVSDLWDNSRYVTITQRTTIEDEIVWLGYSDNMHVITHWMPLPEPPEEKSNVHNS